MRVSFRRSVAGKNYLLQMGACGSNVACGPLRNPRKSPTDPGEVRLGAASEGSASREKVSALLATGFSGPLGCLEGGSPGYNYGIWRPLLSIVMQSIVQSNMFDRGYGVRSHLTLGGFRPSRCRQRCSSSSAMMWALDVSQRLLSSYPI
jgi:hypothetical protein